jgi:hypothetical protein
MLIVCVGGFLEKGEDELESVVEYDAETDDERFVKKVLRAKKKKSSGGGSQKKKKSSKSLSLFSLDKLELALDFLEKQSYAFQVSTLLAWFLLLAFELTLPDRPSTSKALTTFFPPSKSCWPPPPLEEGSPPRILPKKMKNVPCVPMETLTKIT